MIMRILLIISFLALIALPAVAVEFDHEAHNGYLDDPDCATCHVEDAFSIVPEKSVCLECHDQEFADDVTYPAMSSHGPLWSFDHGLEGKVGDADCASCHAQDFCLECHNAGFADEMGTIENNMANIHRSEFSVSHPISARTDPQLCSSCHENRFCVDCHQQFSANDLAIDSHRRGFRDGTTNPLHEFYTDAQCAGCHPSGSVLPSSSGWSAAHAREARKNLATCQSCHPDGDICLTCHSAVNGLRINPHPKDWSDMSENLKNASDGKTCRRCH